MKRQEGKNSASHVTTGNIFDDLGFTHEEALELKIKSDILRAIIDRIESVHYTQEDLARKLKVHQPDVSNLLRGKISRFSVSKLIQFAARLNLQTKVKVTAAKSRTPVHNINAGVGKSKKELAHV